MSHFPDDVKDDPVERMKTTECVDCGAEAKLEGREKLDYWIEWAYEEGHVGDDDYVWLRHEQDWRCTDCAKDFYPV